MLSPHPSNPSPRLLRLLVFACAATLLAACEQRMVQSGNPFAGSQYDRAVVTMPQDYGSAPRRSSPAKAVGEGLEGLGEKLFGWMKRDGGTAAPRTRSIDPGTRESGAQSRRSGG